MFYIIVFATTVHKWFSVFPYLFHFTFSTKGYKYGRKTTGADEKEEEKTSRLVGAYGQDSDDYDDEDEEVILSENSCEDDENAFNNLSVN